MKIVNFADCNCQVNFGYYKNGRRAIMLNDIADKELIAVASVNLPDCRLEEDEILIKDWSENEGILDVLVNAKIVEDTKETVQTGFCHANICKLLYKGE